MLQVEHHIHSAVGLRRVPLRRDQDLLLDALRPGRTHRAEAGLQRVERLHDHAEVDVALRCAQQCSTTSWEVELGASSSGAGLRHQLLEASDCQARLDHLHVVDQFELDHPARVDEAGRISPLGSLEHIHVEPVLDFVQVGRINIGLARTDHFVREHVHLPLDDHPSEATLPIIANH
jgi:hypothetical protein